MAKTINIAPVTRIEGHGKVTVQMDDQGNVTSAHFHAVEFRGFEKFCEGRMVWEMPLIAPRICGICAVSHHLASAKAADAALGVSPPPAGKKLRELANMGQIIHSMAEHFFFLSAPDLLLGPDSDPAKRSIMGVVAANPELGKKAIRLRKIGSAICEKVCGGTIYPVTAIPGGVSKPLSHEDRFELLRDVEEAITLARMAVFVGKEMIKRYAEVAPRFGKPKTNFLGTVQDGALDLTEGNLRMKDAEGKILEEFPPANYMEFLGERVESYSYMKFPFYKKLGWPQGIYRVGSLARLNVAEQITTPLANAELQEFKKLGQGMPVHENFYYHYARTIEMLHAAEKAKKLLMDNDIVSKEVRVKVNRQAGEGVGVVEAARGTLIHHYWVDDLGKIIKLNLIVATVQNNPALDITVGEVAKNFIKGDKISEGMMNRVEMAVRCYDPCLSCATHAWGKMPLEIILLSSQGEVLDRKRRVAE